MRVGEVQVDTDAKERRCERLEYENARLRARADREQFELAMLRSIASAARRFHVAVQVATELPSARHAAWLDASFDHLAGALERLDVLEEAIQPTKRRLAVESP